MSPFGPKWHDTHGPSCQFCFLLGIMRINAVFMNIKFFVTTNVKK